MMLLNKYLVVFSMLLFLTLVPRYTAIKILSSVVKAKSFADRGSAEKRKDSRRSVLAQVGQDQERVAFDPHAFPKCLIAVIPKNHSCVEGDIVSFSDRTIACSSPAGHEKAILLTEIRSNPKGWGYIGNVTSMHNFKKILSERSKDAKKDVLLYVPDNLLSIRQVFWDSKLLSRGANVFTVPCLYPTVKEQKEKMFWWERNKLNDLNPEYLCRDTQGVKAFAEAVHGVLKNLDVKVNCLAHGSGAYIFKSMKSFGVPAHKFRNIFLVAPNLDYDIFGESPRREDSRSTGKFIEKVSDDLHIIYNPDDRLLECEKIEKGMQRLGYRGTDDIPLSKSFKNIHEGNAQGFVSFADPFRHHFYVTSPKILKYFKQKIEELSSSS